MGHRLTALVRIAAALAILAAVGPSTANAGQSDAAGPHASFPCTNFNQVKAHPLVTCHLKGMGFSRGETVSVTYRIVVGWKQGGHSHQKDTTYHHTSKTDAHGDFTRPAMQFIAPTGKGVTVTRITVEVILSGARGDHLDFTVGGTLPIKKQAEAA